jgi:DNA-binding response OmpR family regulator
MAKILVIDDEQSSVDLMKLILKRDGHEVKTAWDGEQGTKIFDQEEFDLVITDILMPNKDGVKTIQHIRKKNKTLPVIAVSGGGSKGMMDYLAIAEMVGATATMAKPFEQMALRGLVRSCLKPSFHAF